MKGRALPTGRLIALHFFLVHSKQHCDHLLNAHYILNVFKLSRREVFKLSRREASETLGGNWEEIHTSYYFLQKSYYYCAISETVSELSLLKQQ